MNSQDGAVVLALAASAIVAVGVAMLVARQSAQRYARIRVLETEVTTTRQAQWCEGGYFEIPVRVPGTAGARRLRLLVDRGPQGTAPPRFACAPYGHVRVMGSDPAGFLLYVTGPAFMGHIPHLAFVYVMDASTGRPALLRDPPGIKSPTQGVAWTFVMEAQEWLPVMET